MESLNVWNILSSACHECKRIRDIQSIFIFIIKVDWIEDVEKNEWINKGSGKKFIILIIY